MTEPFSKDSEDSSGQERKPDLVKTYALNLPQLLFGGLSENWFLTEIGDFHWEMVCRSFGVYSAELRDNRDRRLFSTFVRIVIEGNCSLQDFGENDQLTISGTLDQFGGNRYFSTLYATCGEKQLRCQLMTSFVTRGEDNNHLFVTPTSSLKPSDAPALVQTPGLARGFRDVRVYLTSKGHHPLPESELVGVKFQPVDRHLFTTTYAINPLHDISGVNLLYFASYSRIADICEREYFHLHRDMHQLQGDWVLVTSTIGRDIYFFGNSNISDQIEYRVGLCEFLPGYRVRTICYLYRKSDVTLIGAIYTIKQLTDMFSDFSFFWRDPNEVDSLESHDTEAPLSVRKEEEIAVIGISAMFPGAMNIQTFWDKQVQRQSPITEIPQERWNWRDYFGDPRSEENKTRSIWGGFIPNVYHFDAVFFGISEEDAARIDPRERLLLQETWHLFENSGYRPKTLKGQPIGVFLGISGDDYHEMREHQSGRISLPNRISWFYDLTGPSLSIDAGTSSSLVALDKAVLSIRMGECSMAIVGGVHLCLTPQQHLDADRVGRLTPEGNPRLCDRDSKGVVLGEAVAVVLLKSLRLALQDGDHIDGIIKGSALNHGGYSQQLLTASPEVHTQLVREAWKRCGVDLHTCTYMELHGACLPSEDRAEVKALEEAFAASKDVQIPNPSCALGSIKTHVGDLDAAAGIASVIQVLMAMNRKWIPGVLNYHALHPDLDLSKTPFYLANQEQAWDTLTDRDGGRIPRRAGVSSLGQGGANAHVVLEEYPGISASSGLEPPFLFVLSARDQASLVAYARYFELFLSHPNYSQERKDPGNLCFTLQIGRESMAHRLACVFTTTEELQHMLRAYSNQVQTNHVFTGVVNDDSQVVHDETVEAMLDARDLVRLGQFWVAGTTIEWTRLYTFPKPRRVPLPSYPFRTKNFPPEPPDQTTKEHPFVKEVIPARSIGWGLVFRVVISPTNPLLVEHKLQNRVFLPWSDHLEIAHAAFIKLGRTSTFRLEDIVWSQPLTRRRLSQDLQIQIREVHNQVLFEIQTGYQERATKFASGRISSKVNEADRPGTLEVSHFTEDAPTEINNTTLYQQLQACGFGYGFSFRSLTRLWLDEHECLAHYQLAPQLKASWRRHAMHPVIVEGVLQAALALDLAHGCPTCLYQPVNLASTQLLTPLSAQGYIHVQRLERSVFHATIYDQDGRPCMLLDELKLEPVQINVESNLTRA